MATHTLELGSIWDASQSEPRRDARRFAQWLQKENVRAVVGYTLNGLLEWPAVKGDGGKVRSLFDHLGIAHLMVWSDHPQWAHDRIGLRPDLQPLLRSLNNHHFVTSETAARELRLVLKWPNSYGFPVGENPDRLKPAAGVLPTHDLVIISGAPPALAPELEPLVESDDPAVEAIVNALVPRVNRGLASLWQDRAPGGLHDRLNAFGRAWAELRRTDPLSALVRGFERLAETHADATGWLRENHDVYFAATDILGEFTKWQRTFFVRYLSRHFRVGVFGSDWSAVGLGAGGWVDHDDQPTVYAHGRLALNIPQYGWEEGIAHKPFQIAACGVPMMHLYRRGMDEYFAPGVEYVPFRSPGEARRCVAALLRDENRRRSLAAAARERVCREHTWVHRLPPMLALAGVKLGPVVPLRQAEGPVTSAPAPSGDTARPDHPAALLAFA